MGVSFPTRYSEHIITTMNTKLLFATALVAISYISCAYAGQMFILDDEDLEQHIRVGGHHKHSVVMVQDFYQYLQMRRVILTALQFPINLHQKDTRKVEWGQFILL